MSTRRLDRRRKPNSPSGIDAGSPGPLVVLGISCDYHDSAAAICVDGDVVAAVQQERLSRIKHDAALPVEAIECCLAIAGVSPDDLTCVVFYEKPLNVLGRFFATRQRQGPRSLGPFIRDLPPLLGHNLMIGDRLDRALRQLGATGPVRVEYAEHHMSHAAAAFFPSPFDTAGVLTVDGVGESATATIGRGANRRVELLEEIRFPNSLGLLYSLITMWCGFRPNDGEYKVMGLAPYGEPRFAAALEDVMHVHEGGGFVVDAKRVGWWSSPPHRMRSLVDSLEGPPRVEGQPLTQREADLAASVQQLTQQVMLGLARRTVRLTGERRLTLAGGVALNCVANGEIDALDEVDELWIQPAAGDAGSALGAALWWSNLQLEPLSERKSGADTMRGAALGPRFDGDEIARLLDERSIPFRRVASVQARLEETTRRLNDGEIVGWFQGRMEFGPRALGHRSILADPRVPTMQKDLNLRVKGREGFRPFAPAVLAEFADEWFDLTSPSPYMLRTTQVAARRLIPCADEPDGFMQRAQVRRSTIPACTHIDGSARVQTVDADMHPEFHALLSEWNRLTGCPVLVNTSFNVADEPVVCTPEDALHSARKANLDLLVMEDCVLDSSALAT